MPYFIKFFVFICAFFAGISSIFAAHPFTDVTPSDPFYEAVDTLYSRQIIANEGDNLFHPNDLINRDFFISLIMGIGCQYCDPPSIDSVIRYQHSPFVDLHKTNPHYYCIASAENNNITQGYITDTTGTTSCEDGNTYSSNPFCPSNTITRIEAAAMLLRQAELWNDTLNQNTERTITITDVSNYWYGYAKKAIEVGLITLQPNGTIGQNDKITRGEFALMAAQTLQYTQCAPKNTHAKIFASLGIFDENMNPTDSYIFAEGEDFYIIPQVPSGQWNYEWNIRRDDGETISGTGNQYNGNTIPPGKWFISVRVIDPVTHTLVATPSTTIIITSPNSPAQTTLGLRLRANPLRGNLDTVFQFTPILNNQTSNVLYQWDYGDATKSKVAGNTEHTYQNP